MSVTVSVNGVSYTIPQTSETGWATNVTSWIQAVSSSTLQKSGGTFTLTAEVDFGGSYGLKSLYYKSRTANVASSGAVRLAVSDEIHWRDNANSSDLELGVNASDQLTFNGNPIVGAAALTASKALRSSAAGLIEASSVTSTELGYVSGVTSAIQTQLDGKEPTITALPVNKGGTGQATANAAYNALSPTTTKGDIAVHTGSVNARQAIGSDGQVLVADATQTNGLKWTTLQQGAKNYITYGSFENNATTGWSLFNTTLTSAKPTGSITAGAASVGTFTTTNTNPLAGTYSLQTASAAAWSAGQGFITDALSIDREDRGAVLRLSFNFEITSGSSNVTANSSTSNTFTAWVYDVTNTTWVEMTGTYMMNSYSGKFLAEVQLPTTCTSARVAILCTTVSAGAVTINWDDFSFGPREIAKGSVVTDWVSYTPTGSMSSGGTYYGKWRRNGDSMEGQVYFVASGAVSPAGAFTINLPSGYSIDSSKLPNSLADYHVAVGSGQVIDNTVRGYPLITYINSTTSVGFRSAETTGSSSSDVEDDSPITFGANDTLSGNFKVPITGWSSNAVISSDFGGRIIAAFAYRSGAQTGVNPNASAVKININSKTASGAVGFDTTNSFDVTTNFRYDVPETGYYNVNGAVNVNTTNVLNNTYFALLKVSGSNAAYGESANPEASQYFTASVSSVLYLTAGQYVELFLYGVGNNSVSTLTVNTSETYLNLYKIQSPQTLMGSEVVAAKYKLTSSSTNLSIADATLENIDYDSKVYDTHNAVTTGASWKFTAPYSGKYRLTAAAYFAAGPTVESALAIYKNGTIQEGFGYGAPNSYGLNGSTTIDLVAGDYISAYVFADSTGASTLYTGTGALGSAIHSFIKIEKVN